MTTKDIRSNKIFRSVWNQLSQIIEINTYHGRDDVERSVRIINALKKRAQERIDNGADETSVNAWLDEMIGCFKEEGYTYEEISNYWRNKVNQLKSEINETLMRKALFLQKMSIEEKDSERSRSISNDSKKYLETANYIAENINYNV